MAEHLPPQEEIHVPGDAGFQLDEESGLYLPSDFEREDEFVDPLAEAMEEFVAERSEEATETFEPEPESESEELHEADEAEEDLELEEEMAEEEEEEEEAGEELEEDRIFLDTLSSVIQKARAAELADRNDVTKLNEVHGHKLTTSRKIGNFIRRQFADSERGAAKLITSKPNPNKSGVVGSASEVNIEDLKISAFKIIDELDIEDVLRSRVLGFIHNIDPNKPRDAKDLLEAIENGRDNIYKNMEKELRSNEELHDKAYDLAADHMSYLDTVGPENVMLDEYGNQIVPNEQLVLASKLVEAGLTPENESVNNLFNTMRSGVMNILVNEIGIQNPMRIHDDISWVLNFLARSGKSPAELTDKEIRTAIENQVGFELAVRTKAGFDKQFAKQISAIHQEDIKGFPTYKRSESVQRHVADPKFLIRFEDYFDLGKAVPMPNNGNYRSMYRR